MKRLMSPRLNSTTKVGFPRSQPVGARQKQAYDAKYRVRDITPPKTQASKPSANTQRQNTNVSSKTNKAKTPFGLKSRVNYGAAVTRSWTGQLGRDVKSGLTPKPPSDKKLAKAAATLKAAKATRKLQTAKKTIQKAKDNSTTGRLFSSVFGFGSHIKKKRR